MGREKLDSRSSQSLKGTDDRLLGKEPVVETEPDGHFALGERLHVRKLLEERHAGFGHDVPRQFTDFGVPLHEIRRMSKGEDRADPGCAGSCQRLTDCTSKVRKPTPQGRKTGMRLVRHEPISP